MQHIVCAKFSIGIARWIAIDGQTESPSLIIAFQDVNEFLNVEVLLGKVTLGPEINKKSCVHTVIF